ncbi:MAG: hypothetical protein GXY13_01125 [Acidimicrobiales bacterium]|nr:hypothetical protein [Acidimicrobiales bacterium]
MLLPVLSVIALLAVIGAVVAVIATRGGDDESAESTTTTTTEPEIEVEPLLLQNVDDLGPNPFGASFSSDTLPSLAAAALDHAADLRQGLASAGSGALLAAGSTPGLYGGSRDDQVCDAIGIADFLDLEADKAAAFAEVLGIPTDGIRQYLTGLTPVILVSDTWVTNHGFADGEATSFPAVLQAGTAVLVDSQGVPRVRCSCGNPLLEPEVDGYETEVTDGDAWDDYDPEQVTVVEPGDELTSITVVDVTDGTEFERLLGAGRTGEIQITLRWEGDPDLDLHVFDPLGEEIYFGNTTGDNGGELDVDVIPGCGSDPASHTENVFFEDDAPSGAYIVFVRSYSGCGGVSEPFALQVVVGGEIVLSEEGSVPAEEDTEPFTFVR